MLVFLFTWWPLSTAAEGRWTSGAERAVSALIGILGDPSIVLTRS
jgi:hypothetical protein